MTAAGDRPDVVLVTPSARTFHPRHYHLFACGLADAGLDVMVVGQPDGADHPEPPVPVRWLPRRRGRLARMVSGPDVMRRALATGAPLVQVNSLELLPWAVVVRALSRRRVIYDSNEDYAAYMLLKEWLPSPVRRPLSLLVGVLEPWLAARLDATLVADEGTGTRFAASSRELLVVNNFPWLSLSDGEPSTAWRYDVTYHGSLPTYHVEAIIATAQRLRDRGLELRWCLAAREFGLEERRSLETSLDEAGLRDSFDVHYNLPFEAMPQLLADTRLGFIPLPDVPKFRRNVPRKIFEFMSVGRPAVASDLPATRRLVAASRSCLLVTPGDPDAYADGLETLLRDPALADEMGRRGRRAIREYMNAEHELAPYTALCRRLATGRSGVAPAVS